MAKVLTGISGNLISAASAGFAPTNSADVSAIASAYQVVSATATQLYAGSSYVTSVNDAPLSASRAGNAANASLANSAWYDGTGRLISSLPDSAAVSAIASAYAESAASSKQDELTFSYDDNKISAINGSALAGQGGGGIDSATVSAIASSYAESAASGKVNTTAVGVTYDVSIMDSVVTGISGIKISADYNSVVSSVEYESSTTYKDYDDSELNQAGYGSRYASALYPIGQWQYYQTSRPLLQADWTANTAYPIAQNSADTWRLFMVPYGVTNYGNTTNTSDIVYRLYDYGLFYTATDCVIATGKASLNGNNDVVVHFEVTSLPFGNKNGSACWGTHEPNIPLSQNQDAYPVFAIAGDTSSPYYSAYFIEILQDTKELVFGYDPVTTSTAVSGLNQLPIKSDYAISATYDDSGRALSSLAAESSLPTYSYNTANKITGIDGSAIATGGGTQVVTSTASAQYMDSFYNRTGISGINGSAILAYSAQTAYTARSATSARSAGTAYYAKYDAEGNAFSSTYAKTGDLPTYSYDAEDKISAINGSAIAGGAGGVDSATVSAIASSYAESAVSSYQPLSGMSGYASAFSAGEGLEFVQSGSDQVLQVEAPVDIMAGPGIVIDNPDGNTLRVSMAQNYETVLWSGSANSGTFSENISAFEKVMFHMRDDTRIVGIGTLYVDDIFASGDYVVSCGASIWDPSQNLPVRVLGVSGNHTGFTTENVCYQWWAPNDGGFASFPVTKVVGVHRLANN